MTRLNPRIVCAVITLLATLPLLSAEAYAEERWHRGTASAFETAESQGAPVLMLLRVAAHGETDLDSRVLSVAQSLSSVPVGVELVYPEQAYAQPGVAREFVKWADMVGANSLPALAWFGDDGRPYGLIELESELTNDQLGVRLASMLDRYESCRAAYDRAAQLEGTERAQSLHEGLQFIDPPCRASYQDVMQQIVSLDAENSLGLKEVYEPVLTETAINTAIQEQVYPMVDAGAFAQAFTVLETLITEQPVSAEQRQLLMAFQAQLLHSQSRTQEAIALIDQAIAISSETPAKDKLVMARLQFMSH